MASVNGSLRCLVDLSTEVTSILLALWRFVKVSSDNSKVFEEPLTVDA